MIKTINVKYIQSDCTNAIFVIALSLTFIMGYLTDDALSRKLSEAVLVIKKVICL